MKLIAPFTKSGICLAAGSLILALSFTTSASAAAKKVVSTPTASTSATGTASADQTGSSTTSKGNTPNGKPFRYIQSQIADLQAQIDNLVGRVTSLEDRVTATEAAIDYLTQQNIRLQALIDAARTDITRLQQRVDTNDALIALLQTQLDQIKAAVAAQGQILDSTCPEGQLVHGYSSTTGLICSVGGSAGGLVQMRVSNTFTVDPTSSVTASVDCPAGSFPTGGAYDFVPGLVVSEPGSSATGYGVTATNPTGAALVVNVYSNCLSLQH